MGLGRTSLGIWPGWRTKCGPDGTRPSTGPAGTPTNWPVRAGETVTLAEMVEPGSVRHI
jgi:hypothetical protein